MSRRYDCEAWNARLLVGTGNLRLTPSYVVFGKVRGHMIREGEGTEHRHGAKTRAPRKEKPKISPRQGKNIYLYY